MPDHVDSLKLMNTKDPTKNVPSKKPNIYRTNYYHVAHVDILVALI